MFSQVKVSVVSAVLVAANSDVDFAISGVQHADIAKILGFSIDREVDKLERMQPSWEDDIKKSKRTLQKAAADILTNEKIIQNAQAEIVRLEALSEHEEEKIKSNEGNIKAAAEKINQYKQFKGPFQAAADEAERSKNHALTKKSKFKPSKMIKKALGIHIRDAEKAQRKADALKAQVVELHNTMLVDMSANQMMANPMHQSSAVSKKNKFERLRERKANLENRRKMEGVRDVATTSGSDVASKTETKHTQAQPKRDNEGGITGNFALNWFQNNN